MKGDGRPGDFDPEKRKEFSSPALILREKKKKNERTISCRKGEDSRKF